MHEIDELEKSVKQEAKRISEKYGGAPVVVVVGGDEKANIHRTMTGSWAPNNSIRLRDLVGILQTSIQIESWKHFKNW